VVSVTDPYGRILDFLDRSRYYFYQVAPQFVLTRLSGPRSRRTTFFLVVPGIEGKESWDHTAHTVVTLIWQIYTVMYDDSVVRNALPFV
jgi:hypothetical protein